jgi:hypothetical protein
MSWFSDTFSTIGDFFSSLWDKIQPDIKTAEEVAVAFFSAAINDAATQLGVTGLKIITEAVVAAETTGGTGVEKAASALASVKSNFATAEISVPAHIINAALEAAVSQLNAAKTTQAPAVDPALDEAASTPAA